MNARPTADLSHALVSIPLGLAFTWALFSLIPLLTSWRGVTPAKRLPVIVELVELPPLPIIEPPPVARRPPPPKPLPEKKKEPPVVTPPPKPTPVMPPPVEPPLPTVPRAETPPLALPASEDPVEEPATIGAAPTVSPVTPEVLPDPRPAAEPIETPAPPPPEALPVPVPFFRLTAAPAFAHRETPEFPEDMKRIGRSGTVEVTALIDAEGKVRQVEILKSAGKVFDEAAEKAMLGSTFVPGRVDGRPVAVRYRTTVRFRLK